MLQSLRQQVSESENHNHDEHQKYSELQIEISQLKQQMKDKVLMTMNITLVPRVLVWFIKWFCSQIC